MTGNDLPAGLTLGQMEQAVQMIAQQMGSVAKMLSPNADRKGLLAIVQLAALRICVGAFVEAGLPEEESVAVFRGAFRAQRDAHAAARAALQPSAPRVASPPRSPSPDPEPAPVVPLFGGPRKPSGSN